MSTGRRRPMQQRSRQRVEQILDTAARVVREGGVGALSTRTVAERSGIPIPTVYRYFESGDAIIGALVDLDAETINAELATAVLELERVSLRSLAQAAVLTHLRHHEANRLSALLWFAGRENPAVRARVRHHDDRLAEWLEAATRATGLVCDDSPAWGAQLLMRLADRMFEFALAERDVPADRDDIVAHFIDMIAGQLERYGTRAGIEGIPVAEFARLLGEPPAHLSLG